MIRHFVIDLEPQSRPGPVGNSFCTLRSPTVLLAANSIVGHSLVCVPTRAVRRGRPVELAVPNFAESLRSSNVASQASIAALGICRPATDAVTNTPTTITHLTTL